MFDFHEKRKIRRILYSKTVTIFVLILAILLSFSVYDRYLVSVEMKAKLDEKYKKLEELEMRAQALESKVDYLHNERGVEEELRNRFDVAKEGEQVIILLDSKQDQKKNVLKTSTGSNSVPIEKEKSFWSKFKFW